MTFSRLRSIALAIACVSGFQGSAAFAQGPLTLEGSAHLIARTVDETGKVSTKLVKPEVVVPGDRILFKTSYANVSSASVTNFMVTNPIPASVQLAANADPALTVSVDGGANWGLLKDLEVPDGANSTRPARASDVTHLRWVIPEIAADATGYVEYVGTVR